VQGSLYSFITQENDVRTRVKQNKTPKNEAQQMKIKHKNSTNEAQTQIGSPNEAQSQMIIFLYIEMLSEPIENYQNL